ncbi:conserved hypothetical protein [uncultured Paludibacter sp.]|uniref:Uncharacterized protein n=1 Tax=uncultured Paludibacter sp. TaxID=497635 RepID=A0A653AAY3_9BACT|nr:conserved hypothetical protein [uncultured Paludibacter sp.]
MKVEKFTENDRKLVIEELERIQKVKLISRKSSRKLFLDENGLPFVIFGGREDWHGITSNSMNELNNYKKEGAFVIVKKFKTKMEINVGSLSVFVSNQNNLIKTKNGGFQFHCITTEDGLYIEEIPDLYCNKVSEIYFPDHKKDLSKLRKISKIINIEIDEETPLTHSDIQAKLLLIGSYLNYRTYTPDKSKKSIYGYLGDLCTEKEVPIDSIPKLSIDTVKYIDVIWFDEEGYPTHAFEVEHTTDITKGLLRLYQIHKLRIRLYIIAEEENKAKFDREIQKNPFSKIKQEYIFKNYQELDDFFESVRVFAKTQEKFLKNIVL